MNDTAPHASSNPLQSLVENSTAVATLQAMDADAGAVPAPFSWRVSGGVDAALFQMDALTGALRFLIPPNFEAPQDANADGRYEVTVAVSDGLNEGFQAVSVQVQDTNENPQAPTLGLTVPEAAGGALNLAAAATDAEAGVFGQIDAGSVVIDVAPLHGQALVQPDGSVRYVHDGSETTQDSFAYHLADAGGLRSNTASVSVIITPVNDAPQITQAQFTLSSGQTITLTPAMLATLDADAATTALHYAVLAASDVRFEAVAQPGVAVATFTQAQVDAGQVRMVATSLSQAPAFTVQVSDGLTQDSRVAQINFVVIPSEPDPVPVVKPAPAPAPAPAPEPAAPPAVAPAPVSSPPAPAAANGEPSAKVALPESGLGDTVIVATAAAAVVGMPSERLVAELAAASNEVRLPAQAMAQLVLNVDLLVPVRLEEFLVKVAQQISVEEGAPLPTAKFSRLQASPVEIMQAPAAEQEKVTYELGQVESVQAVSLALTAGTVWWALRAGGLLASLAMALPTWRHIDLLAVLPDDDEPDDDWAGDVDEESARDERDVDALLMASQRAEKA